MKLINLALAVLLFSQVLAFSLQVGEYVQGSDGKPMKASPGPLDETSTANATSSPASGTPATPATTPAGGSSTTNPSVTATPGSTPAGTSSSNASNQKKGEENGSDYGLGWERNKTKVYWALGIAGAIGVMIALWMLVRPRRGQNVHHNPHAPAPHAPVAHTPAAPAPGGGHPPTAPTPRPAAPAGGTPASAAPAPAPAAPAPTAPAPAAPAAHAPIPAPAPVRPEVRSVRITGAPTRGLNSGQTWMFRATVDAVGGASTDVTWTASAGNISSTGRFTPPTLTTAGDVTVTVKSVHDNTKLDRVTFQVLPTPAAPAPAGGTPALAAPATPAPAAPVPAAPAAPAPATAGGHVPVVLLAAALSLFGFGAHADAKHLCDAVSITNAFPTAAVPGKETTSLIEGTGFGPISSVQINLPNVGASIINKDLASNPQKMLVRIAAAANAPLLNRGTITTMCSDGSGHQFFEHKVMVMTSEQYAIAQGSSHVVPGHNNTPPSVVNRTTVQYRTDRATLQQIAELRARQDRLERQLGNRPAASQPAAGPKDPTRDLMEKELLETMRLLNAAIRQQIGGGQPSSIPAPQTQPPTSAPPTQSQPATTGGDSVMAALESIRSEQQRQGGRMDRMAGEIRDIRGQFDTVNRNTAQMARVVEVVAEGSLEDARSKKNYCARLVRLRAAGAQVEDKKGCPTK